MTGYKNNGITMCSLFLVLCSFLFISGCASSEDIGRLQWEVNTLKSDMKNIKKTSRNIETQLPGQTKQLDTKLTELEEKQESTSKTVSDLLIEVQDLAREVQKLTGQFEEARYFSEKSSAEFLEGKEMLLAKVRELELAINDLKTKSTAPAIREPAVAKKAKRAEETDRDRQKKESGKTDQKTEVKDVYMAAYQSYREGKTEESRELFMSVLNDYPKNEYSDNARFWIAESYYKDENFEDAILAYEELFKQHPQSDKVPGAMLKQGLAFYALKDKKTGKIVLEKLIEKYPDSEQARLAVKKINKPVTPKKKK